MTMIEIKVPVLPESIADATVATWHKKPGDHVKRDETLVDIETDKVMLEVPAPADGILMEILKAPGSLVHAQELIGQLQAGTAATAKENKEAVAPTPTAATEKKADNTAAMPAESLSPAVRRFAAEHDVDPQQVSGTGKGGRVTKEDVSNYLAHAEKSR